MSDELTAQPFWVQSYIFFCKYANFGVSLQQIWGENKNYIKFIRKLTKISISL